MEIEKKYLVEELPEDLAHYDKSELEQCYLCAEPTIRARKSDDSYILTYKSRKVTEEKEALNISEELEVPLNAEAYAHLKEKADGICIVKTRYRIPYGKYQIELDVFHGEYEGFCLAEVEFPSVEEGRLFTPPSWFGKDVSGDFHYTNSYLSSHSPSEI
ncbi:MAG: CYTH domain-containing protein [Lachnospiraceae bacterium]|nr:CYTH domain-containing protein [Lachnospiraceae bacterium]